MHALKQERLRAANLAKEMNLVLHRAKDDRLHHLHVIAEKDRDLQALHKAYCTKDQDFQALHKDFLRMKYSRSWRWTAWIRRMEAALRGKPSLSPEIVQPPVPAQHSELHPLPEAPPAPRDAIAVVIPCHNYAQFLAGAIESVLAQSLSPSEILVVDDASTDATREIAEAFSSKGVIYLRGEWRSVCAARNAGAKSTHSPLLVFLDAYDELPPEYLRMCAAALQHERNAIAYGDMHEFGASTLVRVAPAFDPEEKLDRENFISSHAMIRRMAFAEVGGYREFHNAHEDWDLYRRITNLGWLAEKAQTFVRYRIHPQSKLHGAERSIAWSYYLNAELFAEPVSIMTSFTGHEELLQPYVEGLRSLAHDHACIRLHWLDMSGNARFTQGLREILATLDVGSVTLVSAPLPTPWSHSSHPLVDCHAQETTNAQYDYEMALVRAYNRMLQSCNTAYVLTLR